MDVDKSIRSNIGRYYLATSLSAFAFYTPIIQLFYLVHGLTVFKIAILGVVWTVTRMILEVPSSVLADKWGRKRVMMISTIFTILQLITLIYSREYIFFVLASVWSAGAFAFLSGVDVAFFYDTLKSLKMEANFDKLWAKQQIYQQIPFTIAFLASGVLFNISPSLPFKLSLLFMIPSAIMIAMLTEPKFHKPVEEVKPLANFKQSVQLIFNNQHLKFILLFTLIFSLGSDYSYGYGQVYLNQMSMPVVLFGVVFVFKSFLCTVSANAVSPLRKKISDRGLFGFQIIAVAVLLFIMVATNNFVVGAFCFALTAIPYGFFEISKSSYMHRQIESHRRATVGSLISFFVAVMFLILEPIFGRLADGYSIKLPFLIIAVIMSVYSVYYLSWGHKKV